MRHFSGNELRHDLRVQRRGDGETVHNAVGLAAAADLVIKFTQPPRGERAEPPRRRRRREQTFHLVRSDLGAAAGRIERDPHRRSAGLQNDLRRLGVGADIILGALGEIAADPGAAAEDPELFDLPHEIGRKA